MCIIFLSHHNISAQNESKENTRSRAELNNLIKEQLNKLSALYLKAMSYSDEGDLENALKTLKEYDALKDTVNNMVINEQLNKLEIKYETEKKDNEIKNIQSEKELLSVEILRKKEMIDKRNTLILIIIVSFILFSVLGFFLIKMLRVVRSSNKILTEQNEQIEKQKSLLSQQSLEIFRQKNNLSEQHKIVSEQSQRIAFQNKEINESIDYASMIQKALFPAISEISGRTEKHFIIHSPSGNTSNAFYWNSKKNHSDYYAVAESSNSEIAGAMLTVLGVSLLNELIIEKKEYSPGEMLDKLRNNFIRSLHIKNENNENAESYDIAILKINHQERKIEFAGANIPVYHNNGTEFKKTDPDFMPVGISNKMGRKFANKQIEYNDGTKLCLMTNSSRSAFDEHAGIKNFYAVFNDLSNDNGSGSQQKKINQLLEYKKLITDFLIMGIEI